MASVVKWIIPGIVWWIFNLVLKLLVLIPGYFVVPILWRYRHTHIVDMPWWSMPWVNPEDWNGGFLGNIDSLPVWWKSREGNDFWAFYKYHARRNPADGLRNFKWLQLWIDKDKVYYWTPKYFNHYEVWYERTPGWRGYIAGQKFWVGIKIQWVRKKSYSEVKLGFRVEPADAKRELPDSSARKHLGASMASKIKWYRRIR